MLWSGISIEPEWVVLALLVIAIALGRGKTFIADWAPFLLLFFAYEAMRGFAAKTGFAPHDLSGLEQVAFGGMLPTLTLQHAFYRVETVSPQDVIAMFFYFMHFPMPIVVGFVFWLRSRDHFHHFIGALLLMAFLSFVTYLFWPSAPPWYQFQEGHVPPSQVVHKILNETVDKLWGSNYFVSPLYTHLNPNQFAAFPSLHAAFPALAAVYAWNRFRCSPSDSWPGRRRCSCRSCISASTTWSTRSMAFSTSRSRRFSSKDSSDGGRGALDLRLPDLPHDGSGQLLGIVVRRDAHVDDIGSDEANLGVLRGVARPENH